MNFVSVWPLNANELDYDSDKTFDEDGLEVVSCQDYDWKELPVFLKEAKLGNFIFIRGEDGLEGIIFRNK